MHQRCSMRQLNCQGGVHGLECRYPVCLGIKYQDKRPYSLSRSREHIANYLSQRGIGYAPCQFGSSLLIRWY